MAEPVKKNCPCTWPGCENHGKCKACQANHHPHGEKTACEKLASGTLSR